MSRRTHIEIAPGELAAGLRPAFRGELLWPGEAGYEAARRIWNGAIDRRPALIARCTGVADVLAAVRFARERELPVAVRGGGHNVAGTAVCDAGLVIDLSPMKGMRVDPAGRRAHAQPGLLWGEFDRETQAFGLAAPGGIVTHTGVAGLTLGGGIGWLMRKHGLTCDNLRSVDIVTADGQFVRASAAEHPELFWGVRGGGGNFGIVTSFEFALHPVGPTVLAGGVLYPAAEAAQVLRRYREYAELAPEELTTILFLRYAPPLPVLPEHVHGQPVIAIFACYAGPVEEGERAAAQARHAARRPRPPHRLHRAPGHVRCRGPARAAVLLEVRLPRGVQRRGDRAARRPRLGYAVPEVVHDHLPARRRRETHRRGRRRVQRPGGAVRAQHQRGLVGPGGGRGTGGVGAGVLGGDAPICDRRGVRELPGGRGRGPGAGRLWGGEVPAPRRAQEAVRSDQLLPAEPKHQAVG